MPDCFTASSCQRTLHCEPSCSSATAPAMQASAITSEAGGVAARYVLGDAKQGWQTEAAEATRGADHTGDDADPVGEALRHELEDGAVTHAEQSHRAEQHGDHDRERRERGHPQDAAGDANQQEQQQAIAADPVREPAANRPQQAAGNHDDGREVAGSDPRDQILLVEEGGQEAREPHEAAERHAVQQREPEGVRLSQHGHIIAPGRRSGAGRAVLGEQRERDRHENDRQDHQAERVRPPESLGEARREQRGDERS